MSDRMRPTDIPADVVRIVPLELSRIHGSSCEHDVFEARCSPLDLRLDQCCHIDVRPVRNRDRTVSPRRSCSQMRDSAFLVVEGERLAFVVRATRHPHVFDFAHVEPTTQHSRDRLDFATDSLPRVRIERSGKHGNRL